MIWPNFRKAEKYWPLAVLSILVLVLAGGCGESMEESRRKAEETRQMVKETRQMLEETRQMAAEARQMAEETARLVNAAYDRAEKVQQEARQHGRESAIQSAVQQTALAEVAHMVESGQFTDDFDLLHTYGWRRNPDMIYDIKLGVSLDGSPNFKAIVRHKDGEGNAYIYDQADGRGVRELE